MALINFIEGASKWWRGQTEKTVTAYADFHGLLTTEDLPQQMLEGTNFKPVGEGKMTRPHPLAKWRLDEGTVVEFEQPEV